MPLQVLQSYITLCRVFGTTPTWEGLRVFRDSTKTALACAGTEATKKGAAS